MEAGSTLTICSGVEVVTQPDGNYIYDFTIDGVVNATGVEFDGYTDLNVRNGETLNLTGSVVSGGNRNYESSSVEYQGGALGTVTGTTFNIPVYQYSGTKAVPLVSFSGNTFQAFSPVYTYGSLVEDFTDDNTFNASGGTSSIYIQGGTLSEDASWWVEGTATQYVINDNFTVDDGATLTIEPGDFRHGTTSTGGGCGWRNGHICMIDPNG